MRYSIGTIINSTIFLFLCTGCLTQRKIDRWIGAKYEPNVVNKPRQSDYISIKMPAATTSDILAKTEKRKMKMLPLLFYWKWEYGTISALNQSVPGWYFNSSVIHYANSKGLKQKLNGQKVELTVEKMPAVFSVVDKGGLVFLVLWYVTWDQIFMDPQKQDMVVSYRLMKDNVETKTGTITVSDRNKALNVKVLRSVKKTFWEYLDQYNSNVQGMSKEVIDKLIAEL